MQLVGFGKLRATALAKYVLPSLLLSPLRSITVSSSSRMLHLQVGSQAMARAGSGHNKNKISLPFLNVHFGGLQNLLRLRTDYRYNDRLAAEFGADFNVQQQSVFPAAVLQYEVSAELMSAPQGMLSCVMLHAMLMHEALIHYLSTCADCSQEQALGCATSYCSGLKFPKDFHGAAETSKLQCHREAGVLL